MNQPKCRTNQTSEWIVGQQPKTTMTKTTTTTEKKHVEMLPLRLVPIDIRNTLKSIFLQCININHKYSHKFSPSGLLFYVNFRMVLWRPHSEYNHFACVPIPMEQPKCWVSQGEGEGERVCVHDRKEYELRSVNMRSTHVRYARV